ncbi:MAG: S9 family peptidase [Actinomycetota bacterium]|nr:S9 family peptidase [Actinomycetota bacterium]
MSNEAPLTSPPSPEQRAHTRVVHGTSEDDPWFWLRDRDDPAVLAHLEAENAHTEATTAHLAELRDVLFDEIRSRVQETDQSLPVPKGPWEYRVRTVEGLQYPIHVRRPRGGSDDDEVVLLDENALADGHEYFSLGDLSMSPDHGRLAYTVDTDGDEEYSLTVIDIDTGDVLDESLTELSYGLVWANDNRTLFTVCMDEARRPDRVIRHVVGTDTSTDTEVFREDDERFWVGIGATRSERFVVVGSESKTTSEYWVIDADDPTGTPRVIEPRREGVEYRINHQHDRFLILTNDDAVDFRLMQAPVETPGAQHWKELIPHRPGVRIEDVDTFDSFTVVSERRGAVPVMSVIDVATGESHDIEMPEPVYEASPGSNAEFETETFRYGYTSMVTPPSVFELDRSAGTSNLLKQQPVLGDTDLSLYRTERTWATAPDGEQVPISVVWRPDRVDGPAPCLLYGYGSYEVVIPASFSSARLSLLDRGVVFAIAHVRGGGELGRRWYEQGRLEHKHHTFSDFVACAEHLVAEGRVDPERIVARGGSAGGLLMGVVANERPDLFAGIVAEVPFVDNVNTMLDASIPLTVTEYDEWGDPNQTDAFTWMSAYGPYENVEAADHPALLVTAGLNDPRVQYWEPAKWVAKLRARTTSNEPILLKTELGAGHGGPSGRYDAWHDEAFVLSFVLDVIGLG